MSEVESRLAPLIHEIRQTRQRAGALSFGGGQAFIYVFFGRSLHATAPGGRSGPDAVRYIGRMVAEGATYEWTSAASGPTFSLEATTQGLVDLLLEGGRSAGDLPEVIPAPANSAVPQSPTPVPHDTRPAVADEVPEPARQVVAAEASPVLYEDLTPVAPPEPEPEQAPTVIDAAPGISAVGEADGEEQIPLALPEPATPKRGAPPSEIRMPALLAGPTILEETPVSAARLDTFLGDAPRAQLVYHNEGSGTDAVALFEGSRLTDALWCGPDGVVAGPAAYDLIASAATGTVSLSEIPEDVRIALPASWRGQVTLTETPVADVDLDQLNVGLENDRATAALQFTTATDRAVVLFFAGRMVAAYTASAPHRQMNRNALTTLVTDPTASVMVHALPLEEERRPLPSPIVAGKGAADASAGWDDFLAAAHVAARARLQSHSHRVDAILAAVAPGTAGVEQAVRQVRTLVQRGVSPQTMGDLADEIEGLATSRL